MLWHKDELQSLFGIDAEADGVSIDTRTLEKDDLFFGLIGENGVDGMTFKDAALAKGASAVVAGLDNLQTLGAAARDRSQARRIAVTGSVGKTTTKEFLATCFAALGETHAATASFNNHIGVPLTLSRMPRESEFGIFEIGMNHVGEIAPLAQQVRPHVAIITNIAPVHIEYMGSLDAIADEKVDILTGLEEGGVALLPFDSLHFERLRHKATNHNIVSFGVGWGADIHVKDIVTDESGTRFSIGIDGVSHDVFLPGLGTHVVTNAAAALGAVHVLGLDVQKAVAALAQYEPMAGRGAKFTAGGITVYDESYNASPISVAATLRHLAQSQCSGRKIAILGDMRELGEHAAAYHAGLASDCAGIDSVYTCGADMRHLHDALPQNRRGGHYDNSEAVAADLKKILQNHDCVLIKGSNGMKMKKIVEAIRSDFA